MYICSSNVVKHWEHMQTRHSFIPRLPLQNWEQALAHIDIDLLYITCITNIPQLVGGPLLQDVGCLVVETVSVKPVLKVVLDTHMYLYTCIYIVRMYKIYIWL